MTWLVTGGAGYIGSHVARAFAADGHPGRRARRPVQRTPGLRRRRRAVLRGQRCRRRLCWTGCFDEHDIVGVVHLAGFKYAGVSVSRPLHTYTQNVTGMVALLEAMAAHDVDRFVFSSSAAVYGTPETGVVTEDTPTRPESPYGESKLIGEWLLADQSQGARTAVQHTSLRYFNVVGSGYPDLRDTSPHNLFPLDLRGARRTARRPTSTATTTPPRTAPASATTCTSPIWPPPTSPPPRRCWRAGRSSRSTTWAAAPACRSGRSWTRWPGSTGIDFTPEIRGRRPGDPAQIVATGELAARDLDWRMRHTVDEMVASAWAARQAAIAARLTAGVPRSSRATSAWPNRCEKHGL